MQATFFHKGTLIDYTPSSAVGAGDVIMLGTIPHIARGDIAANKLGALYTSGVFIVAKVTGAVTVGAPLYWDIDGDPLGGTAGTGAATTNSGAGELLGYAALAAAETDTTVRVKVGVIQGYEASTLTNLITDPGDAGAIPVTASGSVQLVTAGAETRTLAVPSFVGQLLSISMKTDGGDAVLTVTGGVNQTGNNTCTFNDAGDVLVLIGIESGSNKRWRVVSNDGVALSTV